MMIGMKKKSFNNEPMGQKKILKTEIFIVTMGMENTTNNAVSEQINSNQQSKALDNDNIGPEHHPC